MQKKIYILKLGHGIMAGAGIYSESKAQILKLWEAFNEGDFVILKAESNWDEKELFYWPERLTVQLQSKEIYLHEGKEKALKAKEAHEHAKKVGIITKKKKKSSL